MLEATPLNLATELDIILVLRYQHRNQILLKPPWVTSQLQILKEQRFRLPVSPYLVHHCF